MTVSLYVCCLSLHKVLLLSLSALPCPPFWQKLLIPSLSSHSTMPLLCSWMGPSPFHTLGNLFSLRMSAFHPNTTFSNWIPGELNRKAATRMPNPLHSSIHHPPMPKHNSRPPAPQRSASGKQTPSAVNCPSFKSQFLKASHSNALWPHADDLLLLGELYITATTLQATLSHCCS